MPLALFFSCHGPSPHLPPLLQRGGPRLGAWSVSLSACLCRVSGKPQLGLFISLHHVERVCVQVGRRSGLGFV